MSALFPRLQYRRRAGFTLVELLTVVGVLVVLIAMLLPVVRSVKYTSQRTGCLSNLRQLGVAFQSYVIDNNNVLPDSNDSPNTSPADWIVWRKNGNNPTLTESMNPNLSGSALYRYVGPGFAKALRCPADAFEDRPSYANYIGVFPSSFAFNTQMYLWPVPSIKNPGGKTLLVDSECPNDSLYYYWAGPTGSSIPFVERMSLRHDPHFNPNVNFDPSQTSQKRAGRYGNALFCDFHADVMDVGNENNPDFFDPYPNAPWRPAQGHQ